MAKKMGATPSPTPTVPTEAPPPPAVEGDVYDYAALADAPNTQRSYVSDWKHFVSWCQARRYSPLPCHPDQLATYARHCVQKLELKVSTLQRRLAAINQAHLRNGFKSPTREWVVKKTLQRIRREHGTPARGKDPLLTADLKEMVQALPDTLAGVRDKAILLLGFAGGMRRSEVVALDVEDIQVADEGLVIQIRRSKTDQTGKGRKIGIPYGKVPLTCPVDATLAWVKKADIKSGPLFRGVSKHGRLSRARLTDQVVWGIVKKYAKVAGMNPASFGAHSLRAGLVTQATIGGASEHSIQEQTGHKSTMTLRRYMRDANLFRDNAAGKTGL